MPRKSPLPRDLFDTFSERLEALLDEYDDIAEKRRTVSKALKGELSILSDRIAHVRRVLKGTEPPQLEFDGMETPEWKRDSIIEKILGWASRIRDEKERQGKERAKEKDSASEAKPADEKPNGEEKPKKEPKPEGLVWMKPEDGGTQTAAVEGGAYHMKIALDMQWTADWAPAKGERSIVVGGFGLPEKAARAACETHHLKRTAPKDEPKNGHAKDGEKPPPPPLTWKWVRENVQAAVGVDGTYELERLDMGASTAKFLQLGKSKKVKQKMIAIAKPEQEAKDLCTTDHIERWADAILKNAGDGGLVKGDLKGEATKFAKGKKGRRASP